MRMQIGWFNPDTCKGCSANIKLPGFTVPVFEKDDEVEWPPLLWTQVANRLLVNQQKIIQALRMADFLDESTCRDLVEAHRRTSEVISLSMIVKNDYDNDFLL